MSLSRPGALSVPASALARRVSAALAVACALALLVTASAGAVVTTLGEQTYGVQRHATLLEAFSFNPISVLQYGGGPVMHSNATYAIYWDPAELRAGDPGRPGKYHGDWQQLIDGFLQGVGLDSGSRGSVYAITPQYTETGGARAAYSSAFRGGYVDHTTYPSDGCTDPKTTLNKNFACLTDQQLREELKSFIAAHGLHAGLGTIYFLLTPPGVTVCTDAGGASGHCSDSTKNNPWVEQAPFPSPAEIAEQESYERSFCSYHSATTTASSEQLLYATIPWTAGTDGSGLQPVSRDGSDCQDGSAIMQEPNQAGLAPDGYYDHGLPDVLVNQISIQQIATITNPLFNAWNEPLGGNEVPDQCRNWFEGPPVVQGSGSPDEHTAAGFYSNQTIGGRSYYLNTEFNQAAQYYDYPGLRCELHNNLAPSFTPASQVNAGDLVTFDGNESDITLEQSADATPATQPLYRATFSWNFDDGTPVVSGPGFSGPSSATPLYASVVHAYQYAGTYRPSLTIIDAAGNTETVVETLTVVGTPPPGGEAEAGGVGARAGAGAGAGAGPGTGTGATPGKVTPGPVAHAAATSRSLGDVLRRGLTVSYSVNEQVAGHFEVLLDQRTAKRLKITGSTAFGLPAGTPASLVIGRALLVTTKGGHSTLHIKFAKKTVARLRGVHRLALTLRLVVRNASSQSPQTTTVLSTVVLHR
jgi:hypothetical protein